MDTLPRRCAVALLVLVAVCMQPHRSSAQEFLGTPVMVGSVSLTIGMGREAALQLLSKRYDVVCYLEDNCLAGAMVRTVQAGEYHNIASVNFSDDVLESVWIYWKDGSLRGDAGVLVQTLFTLIEKLQDEGYQAGDIAITKSVQPTFTRKSIHLVFGKKSIQIDRFQDDTRNIDSVGVTEIVE